MVLIALVLVTLVVLAGLTIDGGNAFLQQRRAQNAADAACLSGALRLSLQQQAGSVNEALLLQNIHRIGEANGVDDTDGVPANEVNGNITAYYTTADGTRLIESGHPITVGHGFLRMAHTARGVEVDVYDDVDTAFMAALGIDALSVSALAAAAFTTGGAAGGNYAIWADSRSCKGKWTLDWSGSTTTVDGHVHSNQGLSAGGSDNVVTGRAEYVDPCHDPHDDLNCVQVSPSPMPIRFHLADYAPGGRAAQMAQVAGRYYYVSSQDLESGKSFLGKPGLYYVASPHNVKLSFSSLSARVTIVVEDGYIDLSGSEHHLRPYIDGLLFFSNARYSQGDKACSDPVIKMAGSTHDWAGVVYAPSGLCEMSASSNTTLRGGIFCHAVRLNGSSLTLAFDSAYMPSSLPQVALVR